MAFLRKYRYLLIILGGMITGAILLFSIFSQQSFSPEILNQPQTTLSFDSPRIIVGLDESYPPYEYIENGRAKGYTVDIITAAANAIGYQVQFVGKPWNEILDDFDAGKIDVLSGFFISEARKEKYVFSAPHSYVSPGLFTLKNSTQNDLSDMKGKTIAVQAGDVMDDFLIENPQPLTVLRVENPLTALQSVADGDADGALLSSIAQGQYLLEQNKISQIEAHTIDQPARAYAFGALPQNKMLIDQLNVGLTAVKTTGEFDVINSEWFSQYKPDSHIFLIRIISVAIILLLILLSIGIVWNRSLKEQVSIKTNDLLESEARFRVIFENATEGILIIHLGKVIFANPRAMQMLQISEADMDTFDIFSTVHPMDYTRLNNYYKDRCAGKSAPVRYTFRMINKANEERWIMNNIISTQWDNKDVLLIIFSDITQIIQSEKALEDSEERLSLALEASNDGIWDFNILDGITYFSPRYYNMMGFEDNEFPASFNNWVNLLHPDDRASTVKTLNTLLDQPDKKPHELIFRMKTKMGDYRWILSKLKITAYEKNGIPKRISGIHTDITTQREYEETIRKERDLLEQIMQASNNAFIVTDRNGQVSYINPTAQNLLRLSKEEIIGKRYVDLDIQIMDANQNVLHDPGKLMDIIHHSNRNIHNLERLITCKQITIHVLLNASRLEDANHEFDGMVISMIDITESEQVKRELIERDKRIQQIIHLSPIGIAMFDQSLKLLIASEQFIDYFNLSGIQYQKENIRLISPTMYEKWHQEFERALLGEKIECLQDDFTQQNAQQDFLHWVCCPWYKEENQIGGVLFYMEITTKQVEAFSALQESEDKFSKIFHTTPDAIYINRLSDKQYMDINESFTTITGYTREDVIGKTSLEINVWKSPIEREEFHHRLEENGEVLNYEAAFRMKDGTIRYGLISSKTIEMNQELYQINITRDITDIREANAKIMQMNLDLEDKVTERTIELERKNKELETFTYSVSHDLKAPLRGIDGYSRLLLDDYQDKLDEDGKLFLQHIQNSTQYMEKLINDLLTFSRMERRAIAMSRIDLEELVKRILDEHILDQKDTDIIVDLQAKQITTDYESMMQILRNLLDNAFKFKRKDVRHRVEIHSEWNNSTCTIKIIDNGIGFDNKYKDSIFNIFSRLHNQDEYPGTGIGLTIVKKGIERIGASIRVYGQVNQGAAFEIEIRQDEGQEEK